MSVVNKIKLPNNTTVDINDARDVIIGDGVENVVTLTSAEYEALTTKDPDTIYIVTDVSGAVQFVALTMAQYEALSTKDPSTLYIITDASGGGGSGSLVTWGTESGYTVPLSVDGVSKTICLDGYSAGGSGVSDVTLGGTSVVTNNVAALPSYPSVPTISTSITSDATSDTKTASPKAVKTYVDDIVGDIETLLAAI